MAKTNGAGSAFVKIITYILVVLLVLGFAGAAAYFLLRENGVSFYVEYGGSRYYGGSEGGSLFLLPSDSPYSFTVKSLTGGEVNYSVSVASNEANNFDFSLGGDNYRFYGSDESNNDYSEIFALQKSADGFTLTVPKMSVQEIVEEKFGGEIELAKELDADAAYFVVTVTSGESSVMLWFRIETFSITLDPSQIIF